jgi:hypothetical protein
MPMARQNVNVQMTPGAWREHCLLRRRSEWLELRNSWVYRMGYASIDELDERYADVSMGILSFARLLAGEEATS